jgi:hypothetical protein
MHRLAPRSIIPLLLTLLVCATGVQAGGPLPVSFDIQPATCPNPIEPFTGERGDPTLLATAILGTSDLPVGSIAHGTLVIVVPGGGGLNSSETLIEPIGIGPIEDVATPVDDASGCECTADGADGELDLTIYFHQEKVAKAIGADVYDGLEVELFIRGALNDGTPFEGTDCVVIMSPVPVEPETWGRVKSLYRD